MPDEKAKPTGKDRRDQIAALLLRGYTRREVLAWARDHSGWGLADSTVDDYIRAARDDIKHPNSIDLESAWYEAHDRTKAMLREAITMVKESPDPVSKERALALQLKIEGELNKLLGVYSPQVHKVEVEGAVALLDMPKEQLYENLARRLAIAEQKKKLIDMPQDEGESDEQ